MKAESDRKKIIFIQARLTSSRFPSKMLSPLCGYTLCEFVYRRCLNSKNVDDAAVLTSDEISDDKLAKLCEEKSIKLFRGNLNDVLARFVSAANFFGAGYIIRVCGDSPFVDTGILDDIVLDDILLEKYDYISIGNCLNGFLFEIIKADTLRGLQNANDLSESDREHVTKYIRDRSDSFKCLFVEANLRPKELEHYTLTVDYPADIEITERICKDLKGFDFKSSDVLEILQKIKGQP